MGYKIFARPKLKDPVLLACWPGIGNIGIMAVEHIRTQVNAKDLAEIEPWEYFFPTVLKVKKSVIEDVVFPSSRFYYHRFKDQDVIFFIGQQQPTEANESYAGGKKAYRMAHEVMDVALKFGCKRIYTSGAAITMTHHSLPSKVWAIANSQHLLEELGKIPNTFLMTPGSGIGNKMIIAGLNGILLGVARERGIEGICLLGELPVYLQALMLPYPRASKSVVDAFSAITNLLIDSSSLDFIAQSVESKVDELMDQFSMSLPSPLRKGILEGIETLKQSSESPSSLTREDVKRAIDEIEVFFKKERNDEEGKL